MKYWRIKGSTLIIKAPCMKRAIIKLVAPDGEFWYTRHWYTCYNRLSWAEVRTAWGYECIVEEVSEEQYKRLNY